MSNVYPASDATRIKRHPERGSYDRDVVHAILDEALICHLACSTGQHVIAMPTAFARAGETIYVHGAIANRSLDGLLGGAPFSITVTLLDGLVLARSAFHHSMNYRSVVLTGKARLVEGRDEKGEAMTLLVDRMARGRSRETRAPYDWELDATKVIAVEIEHASAKIRSGGPIDDADDMKEPCWAGVVPLRLVASDPEPEADSTTRPTPDVPAQLR
ncbi:pyridoxamine 5'-phosphate oxidase family protein [Sandaracinus amylolyticus]|uniref:Pyridoxamine 5'-phosphate oxidase n=1 Tax=Sandaracinus amylolyticus TaxID=927083 RepID=A0A0F6W0I4_9BACT|nr:pyridoxamine 5'-phosphate oxidase family protein [Sandaracinus amylolyticus]AKF04317.1 Pyridoxamine 5'-phosphate oxidase [Sandaracinus amylolyticus]